MELETSPRQSIERAAASPIERQKSRPTCRMPRRHHRRSPCACASPYRYCVRLSFPVLGALDRRADAPLVPKDIWVLSSANVLRLAWFDNSLVI
jgi:hypothetical protein